MYKILFQFLIQNAFRLFAEPDSFGIYSLIELVEYNHREGTEYPLAQLTFPV